MKKILLPTDFSASAWNAIVYAIALFKNEACTFYLLHTYTPAFYRMDYLIGGPIISAIPDNEVNLSVAGLEHTLTKIKAEYHNPNHTFKLLSAFNILTHEINDLTARKGIDLIVMGTQGATGAKELFLGSNTVYVLRKAIAPVLVIPENRAFAPMMNMLFPTDYKTKYKKKELQNITTIAKMCNASITILHVKEEYDLSEDQLTNKEHLAHLLGAVPHIFVEDKGKLMPGAVIDYIENEHIDLLAMMNRKHSFLDRLFVKHNVDQISFKVQVPFYVIRDTAEVTSMSTEESIV
ncbi:MAG: universal stress protein [Eudoraea sp.]|nr:universal stress protein [Eudoraea sp.]